MTGRQLIAGSPDMLETWEGFHLIRNHSFHEIQSANNVLEVYPAHALDGSVCTLVQATPDRINAKAWPKDCPTEP